MSSPEFFREVKIVLQAIAEGYPLTVQDDSYIIVENPDYIPDNGEDPNLVIDMNDIRWREI